MLALGNEVDLCNFEYLFRCNYPILVDDFLQLEEDMVALERRLTASASIWVDGRMDFLCLPGFCVDGKK